MVEYIKFLEGKLAEIGLDIGIIKVDYRLSAVPPCEQGRLLSTRSTMSSRSQLEALLISTSETRKSRPMKLQSPKKNAEKTLPSIGWSSKR